ncbi:MAG: hypothetical protein II312_10010 [Lachnospiraceae bacterium]|nr:hypothetical protein [Lachnospiraceae bacterium]
MKCKKSYKKRFADLFNYYLFDGNRVIKAENLEQKDTTEIISLYGISKEETHKQKWRDLLKGAIVFMR